MTEISKVISTLFEDLSPQSTTFLHYNIVIHHLQTNKSEGSGYIGGNFRLYLVEDAPRLLAR